MFPKILLIGIGYQKGSGKDTFAKLLMEHGPFAQRFNPIRIGFADALKQEFAGLFDTTVEEIEANKTLWRGGLQWYGTEYVQKILGERNYWVKRVEERVPYLLRMNHRAVIIPDVRFLHEAEFVQKFRGKLVRVNRGTNRTDRHASECELENFTGWTHHVDNTSTMGQLNRQAMAFAEEMLSESYSQTQPIVGI